MDGYNLLTAPVVIEIKADTNIGAGAPTDTNANKEISNGTETCTWSATKDGTALTYDNGIFGFEFTVVNNKGAQLPETGGIGTTIFYVAGSIMVLAAAILLIPAPHGQQRLIPVDASEAETLPHPHPSGWGLFRYAGSGVI